MVGRTIGKYKVIEQIGRGGMGTVYKAIDETLDRPVAIKILHTELLAANSMDRFRAEAMTVARLNHPRIATVYELTREDDGLMMVMEFIAGETCEKLLERTGRLPVEQVVSICSQALDALEHAHNAGVVHRDLKPSNLMLTTSGDVKIMDFGIARVAGAEHLTSDGFMMGTPAYMAPEQVRGEEVDRRMDLYAMAVMLYKLLTARLPHEGDTAFAVIHSQMNEPFRPAREFRPDLPEWLDEVFARGLAKAANDRFQTAAEFRAALQNSGTSTLPKPFDQLETMGPTPTPVSVRMPVMPQPRPAKSPEVDTVTLRKPHLAVAGTLLTLLVVGVAVLAYVALRRNVTVVAPVTQPQQAAAPASPATPDSQPAAPPTPAADASGSASAAAHAVVPASGTRTAAPAPTTPTGRAGTPPAANAASSPASSLAAKNASTPPRTAAGPKDSTTRPGAATSAPASAAVAPPSNSAAAPSNSAASARSESFGDVRALVLDGTKTRELDALLGLEPGTLIVRNRKDGTVLGSVPYGSIAAATISNSKRPRWKDDASVAAIPGSVGNGGFFLSTSKNWLTLQSKTDFIILRLDDRNVQQIISAVEARTNVKVQRVTDNDK